MDIEKLQVPDVFLGESEGHHLRLGDLFRLSFRVFRVRPMRTFLTVIGTAVGIGTVLFLVSLGYGLQYILIGKLATTEDSLISIEAFYPPESGLKVAAADIENITALAESDEMSPVAEYDGEANAGGVSGLITMRAVYPNYFRLSGTKTDLGAAFTEGERGVVVSTTALRLLGLAEDQGSLNRELALTAILPNADGTVKPLPFGDKFKIVGIISDEYQQPFIYLPISLLPVAPKNFQKIYVKAKDINSVSVLRDKIIEKGLLISAKIDLINQAQKIMSVITIILGVFGVAALVVSSIGMFNTMIIGFLERIFEVGIMKSVGATRGDIRNLFLMESFLMGLAGGVGGVLIGIGAAETFNFGLNLLAAQLGGKPIDIFIYPIRFIIFIIVVASFVGVAAGFWPARRAAGLSPKQAFKA